MKNIKFYAQEWQSNGYYPVTCFERKNDMWYFGSEQKNKDGSLFFNMLESGFDGDFGNEYYLYMLENGYDVFSNKEIHNDCHLHKGDIQKEQLKELIYG